MSEAAINATADYIKDVGQRYNDYPMMMKHVKNCVAGVVAEQMEIFGSSGKAAV
jgi:hypothetical protein